MSFKLLKMIFVLSLSEAPCFFRKEKLSWSNIFLYGAAKRGQSLSIEKAVSESREAVCNPVKRLAFLSLEQDDTVDLLGSDLVLGGAQFSQVDVLLCNCRPTSEFQAAADELPDFLLRLLGVGSNDDCVSGCCDITPFVRQNALFDSFLKLGHPHLELLIGLSLVGDLLLEPAELGDKTLGERLQLLSAALDDLLGDPVVEQDVAYTLHEGRYDGGESHVCGLGAMSRKKEQASTWKAELLAAETTDCDSVCNVNGC